MNTLKMICLVAAALSCVEAGAQALPSTQVWLAELNNGIPGQPTLISPAEGYNNQPMFSPDGKSVFFTAEQDDGQTDVARYDIADRSLSLVSKTPESEYSPTPVPGQDAVSVIRVEPPDQIQRLWSISTVNGESTLLMPNVEPVGYHSWIDSDSVAVFILGDTFSLHRASVGDGPSEMLADNIGRTIRKHPQSGQILFVDKNNAQWYIALYDLETSIKKRVMPLFPGIEDFEVDHFSRFWMGYGSKLYRSNEENTRWELTVDFQTSGMNNITRLASSPNGSMLAIVASR